MVRNRVEAPVWAFRWPEACEIRDALWSHEWGTLAVMPWMLPDMRTLKFAPGRPDLAAAVTGSPQVGVIRMMADTSLAPDGSLAAVTAFCTDPTKPEFRDQTPEFTGQVAWDHTGTAVAFGTTHGAVVCRPESLPGRWFHVWRPVRIQNWPFPPANVRWGFMPDARRPFGGSGRCLALDAPGEVHPYMYML